MSIKRHQIVDCARTYVGTPFGHQGRTKGRALDCVGLPLMVAGELGLRDTSGQPMHGGLYCDYGPDPQGHYVLECCIKHLRRKGMTRLAPGDVLCMSVESIPCHTAIYVGVVNGVPQIVHAYSGGVGECVEHELDYRWKRRVAAVFEFPDIED